MILLRSATTDAAAAASMRVLFARQLVPALRPLVADESDSRSVPAWWPRRCSASR